jgi:hypothetical protein
LSENYSINDNVSFLGKTLSENYSINDNVSFLGKTLSENYSINDNVSFLGKFCLLCGFYWWDINRKKTY